MSHSDNYWTERFIEDMLSRPDSFDVADFIQDHSDPVISWQEAMELAQDVLSNLEYHVKFTIN